MEDVMLEQARQVLRMEAEAVLEHVWKRKPCWNRLNA